MANDSTLIEIRALTAAAAARVSAYRYPAPYDVYNVPPENIADNIRYLLAPANQVFGVYRGAALIGFCSFGADAQVAGGDYSAPALDLGIGIDPALTGRGLGALVTREMFAVGRARFDPPAWRTTIAAFNERSLQLCRRLGFHEVSRFRRAADGVTFVIMMRAAAVP